MSTAPETFFEHTETGKPAGVDHDTSVEDAKWLLAAVAALAILVFSSGFIAAAIGA